jgi:hypothetical protein
MYDVEKRTSFGRIDMLRFWDKTQDARALLWVLFLDARPTRRRVNLAELMGDMGRHATAEGPKKN